MDKSERAGEKGEHLSVDEAGIAEVPFLCLIDFGTL